MFSNPTSRSSWFESRSRVEQQLRAPHVEQAPDHRDEHRRGHPGDLMEHRRPVGARTGQRTIGPGLPQPRRAERTQQPKPIACLLDRRPREEQADREGDEPDHEDGRDHEGPFHDPGRDQQEDAESEGRKPAHQLEMIDELADRSQLGSVLAATREAPLHEQPPGPREEATDHRIRDEPREVAEPEGPEDEEGQRRQQRHDHGRRDDGEKRLVDAAERVQRSARGDDRKHGYRRVLDASDHTAGAPSPREDGEGQGGRDEVDADPAGTASSRKPLKTSTANEIARTTSTTPMTAPAETITTPLRSPPRHSDPLSDNACGPAMRQPMCQRVRSPG